MKNSMKESSMKENSMKENSMKKYSVAKLWPVDGRTPCCVYQLRCSNHLHLEVMARKAVPSSSNPLELPYATLHYGRLELFDLLYLLCERRKGRESEVTLCTPQYPYSIIPKNFMRDAKQSKVPVVRITQSIEKRRNPNGTVDQGQYLLKVASGESSTVGHVLTLLKNPSLNDLEAAQSLWKSVEDTTTGCQYNYWRSEQWPVTVSAQDCDLEAWPHLTIGQFTQVNAAISRKEYQLEYHSQAGVTGVKKNELHLELVSALLNGQTCQWIILPPSSWEKLEKNQSHFTAFNQGHEVSRVLLSKKWLRVHKIPYIEVYQKAGDILVVPSGYYYQKILLGWAVLWENMFAYPGWPFRDIPNCDFQRRLLSFTYLQKLDVDKVRSSIKAPAKTQLKVSRFISSLTCSLCLQPSTRMSDWRRHALLHRPDGQVKCTECGLSVLQRRWNTHQKGHQERLLKCELCGKWFVSVYDHQYATHFRDERRNNCQYCGENVCQSQSFGPSSTCLSISQEDVTSRKRVVEDGEERCEKKEQNWGNSQVAELF